ncbi:hypothetical protein [Burkholderia sp. Ac-20365]|uniref:hypothetical protein n=1 Tax=Burkholderia sp. Ac-20365 TaxID=2703897 RepID=UPI00197B3B0C|nr:hypothetical protein [Burkholderia sp. Ac-20365]MBN3765838.1 hypothetical protein [Burkholderia sp. Ac-20365]
MTAVDMIEMKVKQHGFASNAFGSVTEFIQPSQSGKAGANVCPNTGKQALCAVIAGREVSWLHDPFIDRGDIGICVWKL